MSKKIRRRRIWLAIFAVLLLLLIYAGAIEPYWFETTHVDIHLSRLPKELDGLRIVQMSDFHYFPPLVTRQAKMAVDIANSLHPDLIVLDGDYVTESPHHAEPLATILANLHERLGVYAVLGNHDYWTNADIVQRALTSHGISVLRNQSVPITSAHARVWLTGVDDATEGLADIQMALKNIPRNEAVVLLVHEPEFADVACRYPVDLQLSGHTHGGQVRLPFIGALHYPKGGRKYSLGLNHAGSMPVYTTRGVGVLPLALRFGCRPEVTVLTLHSGKP